jgi:5-formyltetrahydrofolate cyclo-ligase
MKTKLANIAPEEFVNLNNTLSQRFFEIPLVKNSNRIMIYYSINHEVATTHIISKLLKMGKTVVLPACTIDRNLRASIIHNLDELVPGIFGIKEPAASALEIDPKMLDLVVIPGVAFDKKGFRLGHGAGYYDRFLTRTAAFKLGIAYDFQIVDKLPAEPHDVTVQALLTPEGYWQI